MNNECHSSSGGQTKEKRERSGRKYKEGMSEGAISDKNVAEHACFSLPYLTATIVYNAKDYELPKGRLIIVNVAQSRATLSHNIVLSSHESTIVFGEHVKLIAAACVVMLQHEDGQQHMDDVGSIRYKYGAEVMSAWRPAMTLYGDAFKNVPLFKSESATLRRVKNDPPEGSAEKKQKKETKINLWFAPAGTNCAQHTHEPTFREVHTQVFGIGHMQKYVQQKFEVTPENLVMNPSYATMGLFEDVIVAPGMTHKRFYHAADEVDASKGVQYPLHQYQAHTDCVWLAIEDYY